MATCLIAMISIEQCKKLIGETNLSYSEIEEIRDIIYALTESVFDDLAEKPIVTNIDSTNITQDNVSISK